MIDTIGEKLGDIFGNLFPVFYMFIVKPFLELKLFKTLIFGDGDMYFRTFSKDEIDNIVIPGMDIMNIIAVFIILVAIVLAGMKISSVGINPSNRSYMLEFFKDLLIVGLLFFNLPSLYALIFEINDLFIKVFEVSHEKALVEVKESIKAGDDVLGQMLIHLCLLGLMIWANFYYMMRKLTLILFMILGPLMVVLLLIPQTRGITLGWLKEFIGTVMVQSIHGFLYWVFALMSATNSGDLESVLLYMIFIPASETIRSLLGLGGQSHNTLSKAGSMFGMSAIAGVYGSVKGAMSDKSVAGALRGAASGVKDSNGNSAGTDENTENNIKKTLGGNTGTDTGTNSWSERMLKAGDVTSKGGKMFLGMAGSVAGAPMGPSGSIVGAQIGSTAGGLAGGLAGRAGFAGLESAKIGAKQLAKGTKSGWNNAKDRLNSDEVADEKLATELAESETSSWASENKEKFMDEMREKFPDAHEDSLEGMWNSKVSDKKNAFMATARETVSELKKNDGSYAKANQVVDKATDQLTDTWADNNKESFMKNYDKNNPITEGTDLETHNKKKQAAWSEAVEHKRAEIGNLTSETAKSMTNGLPANHAYINKEEFANRVGSKMINNEKEGFKDQHRNNFNPEASDNEIDSTFDEKNGHKKDSYIKAALGATKATRSAKASDLVKESTQKMTDEWANNNKASFESAYKEHNPTATKEEVSDAWNKKVADKKAVISTATKKAAENMSGGKDLTKTNIDPNQFAEKVGNELYSHEKAEAVSSAKPLSSAQQEKYFDDTYGDKKEMYLQSANKAVSGQGDKKTAKSLATTSANNMTEEWSDNNKGEFVTSYKQNHPGKSEEEVEIAWDNAVKEKRTEYMGIANSVASKMAKGKDMSTTDINSEQFANNLGKKLYANEKSNFVATAPRKLSNEQIEMEFDKNNASKKVAYVQSAEKAIGNFTKVNASELANKTAENMTIDWANNNQSNFSKNYKLQNPGASESEVEVAWNKQVDGKRKELITVTNGLAQKMTNGKSIQNTEIDSKSFASNLGNELYNNDKVNYRTNYKQQASATDQQIEVEFEKGQTATSRAYVKSARSAVNEVKGGQLYNKKDVNTPYLVSQLATRATNKDKQAYITQQLQNEVPAQEAEQNWQTKEAAPTYQKHLQNVSSQVPKSIPLEKAVNTSQFRRVGGAVSHGIIGFASTTSEAPAIANFAKDTKLGKMAISGVTGANVGYQNAKASSPNGIVSKVVNPVIGGASSAISEMKTSFQTKHVPENAVQKQEGFKNVAAYTTGIVGGVRGYKLGSKVGSKLNPYNKTVNNQVAEISDIQHLAQKVDDGNGNMEIAKGSVQMVTTSDRSYIQVRDKTGQTRVVSRHGAGDSGLKKGDKVFQDLNINNGTLSQDSNPYRYDSAGGKAELSHKINVSPNNLLANRNTRKNPRVVQEVQALNQQVDSGQFYANDVQEQMKNIKMVVTKERSYVMGTDNQGKSYRVSPYGDGDARLSPNESRTANYSVRNRRFAIENTENESGKQVDYHSSLSPEELIPVKANKRASRRNDFETVRHKSLGGTF